MITENYSELVLEHVRRHIDLDKTEETFFISLLQLQSIKKKDFLLQVNDVCRYESFVVRGCLRMYSLDHHDTEHIVMFAVEDWWIGDLYSFLMQNPSSFFIDAIEDCTVLQLSKKNLDLLYEKVPKFERFFRLIIQNAFIAQQQRINQNLSLTAEERYLYFIAKYPGMEQRIPQKQVAAYLGITPEFLSMIRKKLSRT